eukprot:scaffold10258_cov21-Phaeocystis_antarctica.AAC.1
MHIVVERIGRPAVDSGDWGSNRGDVTRKERTAGGFRWLKSMPLDGWPGFDLHSVALRALTPLRAL